MFYRFDLRPLGCIAAGVAIQTLACRSGVAHGCRSKGRVILVAGIALRRRRDMSCSDWLGLGILRNISTAMAGGTFPGRTCVVHLGRGKSGVVLMAGIALGGCRNMGARLAQGSRIVVAVRAISSR